MCARDCLASKARLLPHTLRRGIRIGETLAGLRQDAPRLGGGALLTKLRALEERALLALTRRSA
jgi:hypothetical protein